MKLFLNKYESERKKKNKNFKKYKKLEILLVKNKYADKPGKLYSALRDLKKIEVFDKNLHEIKNGFLEIIKVISKWLVV